MPAHAPRKFCEREVYLHIYNKGVGSTVIFGDESDYDRFLQFINDYLSEQSNLESKKKDFTVKGRVFRGTPHLPKNYFRLVELVSYCLLPDHFHLVLREQSPGGIARFMKSLCTRYSIYFNKKYHKSGALFDRSYKSARLEGHMQLSYLIQYLHDSHNTDKYSSRPEFANERETSWLHPVELIDVGKQTYGPETDLPILKAVMLEKNYHVLASKTKPSNIAAEEQKISRIPEFLIIILVFALLLGTSVYRVSAMQMSRASSGVLSSSVEQRETPVPSPIEVVPLQMTSDASMSAEILTITNSTESARLKSFVVVSAKETDSMVPIYKYPSETSEKLTEAKSGNQFVLVESIPEWYQVLLSTDSIGYIRAAFTHLE